MSPTGALYAQQHITIHCIVANMPRCVGGYEVYKPCRLTAQALLKSHSQLCSKYAINVNHFIKIIPALLAIFLLFVIIVFSPLVLCGLAISVCFMYFAYVFAYINNEHLDPGTFVSD